MLGKGRFSFARAATGALLIFPALIAAALIMAPAGLAAARLYGTVGPGAQITLSTTLSRATELKAGTYLIVVSDRSRRQNFHLIGLGVDKATGVRFLGTVRWSVRLRAGTYRYFSDPHSSLRGSVRVV